MLDAGARGRTEVPARTRAGSALEWLTRRPRWQGRLVGLAALTLLSLVALRHASLVVDGTRYFWLDDDQMISMRYARNWVEGHGLVWNAGEYVEGYTNFLWTLVMAVVHVLPVADPHTAVVVKGINWALACAVLVLSERLLRFFTAASGLAVGVLLTGLAVDLDLVYWSANGFETTLLTATFLLVVVRLLEEWETGRVEPSTYLLLGLLPVIRSDAYHVWAGAALLACGIATDRRRIGRMLALSLVLPVLHVLFRHWYYGEWLPNTYYLKVAAVPGRTALGVDYLGRFARSDCVALACATVGLFVARDRRRWLLAGGLVVSSAYVLMVGEDLFPYARFLAHLVPVVLVLAVAAIVEATRRQVVAQTVLLLALLAGVWIMTGVTSPNQLDDENAEPRHGLVTGVLINRFTRPEATIAVVAAGNVSYFGHRYAIDMLGKSDPHIAREVAHPGGRVGHNKYDPEYSLSRRPDLVVPFWIHKLAIDPWAIEQAAASVDQYIAAVVGSPTFRRDYLPNPVTIPYLLENNSVYVRSDSPEMAGRTLWRAPQISDARSQG